MNLIKKVEENYLSLIYLTIFSIFLANLKLYIPLFAFHILFAVVLFVKGELKLRFSKWQIAVIIFMIWSIINTALAMFVFKNPVSIGSVIKLNLNMGFLIAITSIVKQKNIKVKKQSFFTFMEFIIIINFIQIILIYLLGGFVGAFFSGLLSQNSDAAYMINAYYNVIGADNKNIWSGKFVLLYMGYIYMISLPDLNIKIKDKIVYLALGVITTLLLLSRTGQLALVIPIIFLGLYSIRNISYKYRRLIYSAFAIGTIGALAIFFTKFFHIKFDMTDGGYTRIYIWQQFFKNVWDTHYILGNGIGYSAYFIQTIVERTESNLHNVYMNIFFELGIIGLLSYLSFLVFFLKEYITKNKILNILFTVIAPFLIITCLQYLGFDNDIVMVFVLLVLINHSK